MKRAKGLGATARPTVVAILGAATLLLASCSSTAGSAEAEPAEGQSAATEQSAALPEGVASQGKIVWAVEPYYPPFTLSDDDGGELVGINIDLAHEMSDRLGVEAEIVAGSFDGLIPGVQSQRYDVAIATMADTEPRREQVDFIDYFQSGSAVFVSEGSDSGINGMDDLCGHTVGVVKGTFEVEDAEEQSDTCVERGEDPLDIQIFNEQAGMLLSLRSGRSDAMLMDYVAGNYAATTEGGTAFEIVGDIAAPKRKGMIFDKSNDQLRDAVQQVMQELMDYGRYMEILEEWDQEGGAIDIATLNDGQ